MRILGLFLAAFAAILIFTGCETTGHYHVAVEGPPPPPPPQVIVVEPREHVPPKLQRPSYHRMHVDGCDLVYDRRLMVYTVVGHRDYYYSDGAFFRFGGDGWQASAHFGPQGRWERADEHRVPLGLRSKYKNKDRGHDRRGHDKHDDRGRDDDHRNDRGNGRGHSQAETVMPVPFKEARWGKY